VRPHPLPCRNVDLSHTQPRAHQVVAAAHDHPFALAFYEGELGLTGEETPGGWLLRGCRLRGCATQTGSVLTVFTTTGNA
jgi:hypothetical protein